MAAIAAAASSQARSRGYTMAPDLSRKATD
jgi:hypothetical protein